MVPYIVLLLGFGLAAAVSQLAAQCEFVGFEDSTASRPIVAYTAKCPRRPGGPADICSQLNLAHCLSNMDGSLQPPADGSRYSGNRTASFKESCPSCHVDSEGWRLYCACERLDSTFNAASIALNNIILIQEGILACSTTIGQEISECPITRIGPPERRRFVA
ncbi:hypothetical protein HIM_07496 [Hirsutella minnesotensis 3608]|uniref:Cyanovirin-N domain-containing protein n=1 Tax=Hirsutella minnesotensis 3608 TaxID=1043627 RepID=A0A0F7ZYV1_9HYPO|nr:hypothetical protein HIM_07496 [Hirsutella minnesotensis 3608]